MALLYLVVGVLFLSGLADIVVGFALFVAGLLGRLVRLARGDRW